MGLFKANKNTYTCKLCNNDFTAEDYNHEYGTCNLCLLRSSTFYDQIAKEIPIYEERLKSVTDPTEKIAYLSFILELLYKYKILYSDNNVNFIDGDIDDMISNVIERISEANFNRFL